jgi:hypothetical protein
MPEDTTRAVAAVPCGEDLCALIERSSRACRWSATTA